MHSLPPDTAFAVSDPASTKSPFGCTTTIVLPRRRRWQNVENEKNRVLIRGHTGKYQQWKQDTPIACFCRR
jgi:hypothetical protein